MNTIDSNDNGIGERSTGQVTQLTIAGRGNVNTDATAVALNITATNAHTTGYITVYPFNQPKPASAIHRCLQFTRVLFPSIATLDQGSTCIYTSAPADIIADVNGAFR